MSLDTVMLIMEFEEKFGKQIPDIEAEKLSTIRDVSHWFYKNLSIDADNKNLKEHLSDKVMKAFRDLGFISGEISPDCRLLNILPQNDVAGNWKRLEQAIEMPIPILPQTDITGEEQKSKSFLGFTYFTPPRSFLENSVEHLIYCIGALNYKKLIDMKHFHSLFEVTIAVWGITFEYSGVEMNEMHLDSSFTNDLGID